MRNIALASAFVLGFIGLPWLIMGNDFFLYKIFAPKYEKARREVFEQTKSYRQGMVQELTNMQFEYIKASPEHQLALKSIILHRSADFPLEEMPPNLRSFIQTLQNQ